MSVKNHKMPGLGLGFLFISSSLLCPSYKAQESIFQGHNALRKCQKMLEEYKEKKENLEFIVRILSIQRFILFGVLTLTFLIMLSKHKKAKELEKKLLECDNERVGFRNLCALDAQIALKAVEQRNDLIEERDDLIRQRNVLIRRQNNFLESQEDNGLIRGQNNLLESQEDDGIPLRTNTFINESENLSLEEDDFSREISDGRNEEQKELMRGVSDASENGPYRRRPFERH